MLGLSCNVLLETVKLQYDCINHGCYIEGFDRGDCILKNKSGTFRQFDWCKS